MPLRRRVLFTWTDPQGSVRAWATGPAKDREKVRAAARQQLAQYRRKKARLGDRLARAKYTEHEAPRYVP